eukprot:9418510-Pyramimonas_sp.AAC.1
MSRDPATHPTTTGRSAPWTRLWYSGHCRSDFHRDSARARRRDQPPACADTGEAQARPTRPNIAE